MLYTRDVNKGVTRVVELVGPWCKKEVLLSGKGKGKREGCSPRTKWKALRYTNSVNYESITTILGLGNITVMHTEHGLIYGKF